MTNRNVFGIKGLTDDGHEGDKTLHYDSYDGGMFKWTAKTKKDYSAIEDLINKIGTEHKDFSVYAWCDVSGFNYWVVNQEEPNYIQISVTLKKRKLSKKSIEALKEALNEAEGRASRIAWKSECDVSDLFQKVDVK